MAFTLTLHPLFSDHAVLPREVAVPVHGRAMPGQSVRISLAGQQVTARAGDSGHWEAALAPLPAGGPHVLTVASAGTQIIRRNLLVGDVWLASGQSNMEWPLRDSDGGPAVAATARLPRLRLWTVPRRSALEPQAEPEGRWVECSPKEAAAFSAVAFHFGRTLLDALDAPIGLINASWGGTMALPWTDARFIRGVPELARPAQALDRVRRLVPEPPPDAPPPPTCATEMIEQEYPSGLFNGMIAPLARFPIRGVIWYQGESDVERAHLYRTIFPRLISSWRAAWGRGDFPFLFVQLANHLARRDEPADDAWAELREAQALALRLPATGMVVAADVGDAADIHPRNKRTVGERLALAALAVAYGHAMPHSGPVARGHAIEGTAVRVQFGHAFGGLRARGGGDLDGFEVAGADRRFRRASARIEGTSVVVSHPEVAAPVAVRYAWQANPPITLENSAGLPAAPFRTDDWPGVTTGKG